MDKESAIAFTTPGLSNDSIESIQKVLSRQSNTFVNFQDSMNSITNSYIRVFPAISEALSPGLQSFMTHIQEIQKQMSSIPAFYLTQQFQESMERIQQIQSQSLIDYFSLLAQQLEEYRLRFETEVNDPLKQMSVAFSEIDWEALGTLDDDDEVPEEVQAPVQKIVESNPTLSAELGLNNKISARQFLLDLIVIFSFFFGTPYELIKDIQSAKQEEQHQLIEQQKLELLQQIADNTQNISIALEESDGVFLQNKLILKDNVMSECNCNHSDENIDSKK